MSEPYEKNRLMWDRWAEVHLGSESYDVEGFLRGEEKLDGIVLDLVGDVAGQPGGEVGQISECRHR